MAPLEPNASDDQLAALAGSVADLITCLTSLLALQEASPQSLSPRLLDDRPRLLALLRARRASLGLAASTENPASVLAQLVVALQELPATWKYLSDQALSGSF